MDTEESKDGGKPGRKKTKKLKKEKERLEAEAAQMMRNLVGPKADDAAKQNDEFSAAYNEAYQKKKQGKTPA